MKNPEVSIVIVSFNTKKLLYDCLTSVFDKKDEAVIEVIVVDNASYDGSSDMVKEKFPQVKLIQSENNLGFAKGNNIARKYCKGEFVLLLNSDTIVERNTIRTTLNFIRKNIDVGAMTCRIELPNGKLDKDTRRSFISPWIGLVHIFLKLDKIFPKSRFFGKYWYGYLPENLTHEVDVIQGAFMLVRKKVMDAVGWFDEDYFLDGEDIDLCWKIKHSGWKIIYYPEVKIIHYKGASKGKAESLNKKNVSFSRKLKYRMAGVDSMEKFVRKRLWSQYPLPLILFVISGIKVVKAVRFMRTLIFG